MAASISKRVRDLVRARLQSSDGLNSQFSSRYSDHGLAEPPAINWDVEARQFFEANISFDDVVGNDSPVTPCVFLYVAGTDNTRQVKFRIFSGTVQVQVDVVIEIPSTRAPELLEDYADMVEESLIHCFNSAAWAEVQAGPVSYNGEITTERTAAATDNSSNWRQVISATVTFNVTV
jgi:hypothetical protein